jgi:hypothetical protein
MPKNPTPQSAGETAGTSEQPPLEPATDQTDLENQLRLSTDSHEEKDKIIADLQQKLSDQTKEGTASPVNMEALTKDLFTFFERNPGMNHIQLAAGCAAIAANFFTGQSSPAPEQTS